MPRVRPTNGDAVRQSLAAVRAVTDKQLKTIKIEWHVPNNVQQSDSVIKFSTRYFKQDVFSKVISKTASRRQGQGRWDAFVKKPCARLRYDEPLHGYGRSPLKSKYRMPARVGQEVNPEHVCNTK